MRIKNNSTCTICGDKASGFNYLALSCESCKVFFLRHSNKNFSCVKENNCEIDIATRKSCQRCRLQKCLAVGMTKMENAEEDNPKDISSLRKLLQAGRTIQKTNKSVLHRKLRTSLFTLKTYEKCLISEIEEAVNSVFVDERKLPLIGELPNFASAIRLNYPSMYARRIVRLCKNFTAFKLLTSTDQLIILRQFVIEILVVRTSFLFDIDKNGYPIIENEEGHRALFVHRDSPILLKHHKERILNNRKFGRLLKIELQNDSTMLDLIIALLLFQPRENLSCPEFIQYQYSLHCCLLRRYIQCKLGNMYQAKKKYATLMELIKYLAVMKENYRIMCHEINADLLPEIFVEVFDLRANCRENV